MIFPFIRRKREAKAGILRIIALSVVLFVLSSLGGGPSLALQQQNPDGFVEGRVLIKFRANADRQRADRLLAETGATIEGEMRAIEVLMLRLPPGRAVEAVVRAMNAHPDVEFAELDRLVPPDRIPNDPHYPSQWHLPKIDAPSAWDTTIGDSGLIIAVLDSGVDGTHPDLASKMIPGWNFYDNNSDTRDVHGHGTRVAGIAAAVSDNWGGVASVAWNSLIMPIRISDPATYATFSAASNGLVWAADRGARVANISYRMSTSSTVANAAKYFQGKGGVVAISAGNQGEFDASPDNPYVLTVSATDASDNVPSWSNTGNLINIAAPGVSIYTTTLNAGYTKGSGTSFSAPIVAGVAALVMSVNPKLSGIQVQDILKTSADDLGPAGWDTGYGAGRVNAASAVAMALNGSGSDTTAPTVSFSYPETSDTISGTIAVEVQASDNVGVASVSLTAGGSKATRTSPPYTFTLDTTKLTGGLHTFTAAATDTSGNTAAAAVTVTVSNPLPLADTIAPVPMIASPSHGDQLKGNVHIIASATDNVAVVRIEIYINDSLMASSDSGQVRTGWQTNKLSSGAYVIAAKAYDATGNIGATAITVYR